MTHGRNGRRFLAEAAAAYTTIYKPQVMPLVDREGHPATLLE